MVRLAKDPDVATVLNCMADLSRSPGFKIPAARIFGKHDRDITASGFSGDYTFRRTFTSSQRRLPALAKLAPPFGGFLRLPPPLVELHDPLSGLCQRGAVLN